MTSVFHRFSAWVGDMIDPERPADGPPPDRLIPFLRWSMDGTWLAVGLASLGFVFGGASEALMMLLLGQVVDATAMGPEGFFSAQSGLLLFSVVFLMVLRPAAFAGASAFQSIALLPNLHNQVLIRLNRHTLGHSIRFFDDDFAGRIAQKQLQTANALTMAVTDTINAVVFALSSALGMLLLSGSVSGWMAVIVAVWLAAYFALLAYFLPRIRARSMSRANARAAVTGQIVDTVTNIRTVKLFARDDHEDRAALDAIAGYRLRAIDWAEWAVGFRAAMILLAGVLPVAMVGYGLTLWQDGRATPGDLAAVGAMAIRLSQMTGWVSWTLMAIYGHVGEIEDGIRTLTKPHGLTDAPSATDLAVTDGAVRFDHVSFAYGRETGGIEGIDLSVAPGEKLGIVGASGAGKSTLVALLLRLYAPEQGRILIDGQDTARITQASLREQIGMVTQDTAMFNRSALDNIRYGRPEATEAEVIAAAQAAEAHDFILDLADAKGRTGYAAHLGERGVKLSGGQRQRIALARTILKDAPILVLDEATSALDSEVEAAIQSTLGRVMEGKTVLAIAHRLSTLSEMDRIIVLHQGRIVEDGSHDTLLAQGGFYARYWEHQSGGFIGSDDQWAAAE